MCNFRFSLILPIALSLLSGCGTTGAPPITYAQNPFNPFPVKLKDRPVSASKSTSSVSPSTVVGAADIALNAASPSISGAISPGAGAGIASGLFLLRGLSHAKIPVQTAENINYINMRMPLSEVVNESDAENKARKIMANVASTALLPDYQSRLESYDDTYSGKKWHREWYLVNGPLCENWSCQLIPMLQQSSPGFIQKNYVRKSRINSKESFNFDLIQQVISLVKITNDYVIANDKETYRVVEGEEIQGFDYKNYIRKISATTPPWLYFTFADHKEHKQYTIAEGNLYPVVNGKVNWSPKD